MTSSESQSSVRACLCSATLVFRGAQSTVDLLGETLIDETAQRLSSRLEARTE